MMRLASWLHCPSMGMLVFAALLLGLAPFTPEPHLVEKVRMLVHGELVRPIDIFDLFWHSWPLLWIALRLATPNAVCGLPARPGKGA
ncbi:MAG TPA: hypothetical protein VKA31_03395 [Mariprofundaceae bacterium]|nr:hypothetical protein [Mariprofundaceae bacterium]